MDAMWNSIRSDVLKGLKETTHTGRLIITGISLGGALAVLSYVDIATSGLFDNVEIITYGAPRVGNKKWAEWFDTKTKSLRYFIKGDPIAVLPRCLTLICNYGQTGTPINCNENTQICTLNREDDTKFTPVGILSKLSNAVKEHYMEDEEDVEGGIISHINGYKNLYNYTEVY